MGAEGELPAAAAAGRGDKVDDAVTAPRISRLLGRLGWATMATSLASVLLVAACFYWLQVRPQADATARARQSEAAERVVSRVQGLVGQVERILLTAQAWSRDGLASIDDPAAFNRLLIPVLELRSVVSSVHLASDDGREILLLRTPDGYRNRITDIQKKGTQQQWLSWADARTRSGEEWKEQDYDPRRRPWFSGALATPENRVHWTEPYLFQTTKEPGITASVRWTDKASGRQFVFAMDILLSDFSRSTRDLPYGRHGTVAVLTADGKVLALPRDPGLDGDEALKKAVLQAPEAIGLPLLAAALRMADSEAANGAMRVSGGAIGGGESWLVKLQPIPFGNQTFRIAMLAPESDFSPWSRRLIAALFVLLSTVAVLGVFLSRRLARDVSRPLGQVFEELADSNRALEMQGSRTSTVADLAPKLQNAETFEALGQVLLSGLDQRVALGQGSLYRVAPEAEDGEPRRLCLCSGFARTGDGSPPANIAYGEGLVGQCAVEQRVIRLDKPTPGYLRIASALSVGEPATLLILPVLNNGVLLGVLELALLGHGEERDVALIDSLLPVLALCMEIIARNDRTRELLQASLSQATELAAQQERIQSLLAEQDAIFDNAPMGILYVQNGFICRANAEIAWLLNRAQEDLVGSELVSLFGSAQHYRAFNQVIGQRLADGAGVRQEWQLPVGGQASIWVMIAIQRLLIEGVERAAIWTIEDISERKQMEEATRASEARLRQVLEDSPVAVTMVSEEGEQLFVNRRLSDLLGIPLALLKTRRSSEFWVDAEERRCFVERLKVEDRIDDYEARFRRADGTEVRVVLSSRWIEQMGKRLLLTWMFEMNGRRTREERQ